jgi:alpha-tubulin suppressor-like RCC1 family protein
VGYNASGQLGTGDTNNTASPREIVTSGVKAVALGYYHTLFLKTDGSLWGMGNNAYGQLGDGTKNNISFPEELQPGSVTIIAAGGYHSMFVTGTGTVQHRITTLYTMGDDTFGQLGDTNFSARSTPILIQTYEAPYTGGAAVTSIAAGSTFSLFSRGDDTLWGMGDNSEGQLGLGANVNLTSSPAQILSSGVTSVAAGYYFGLFRQTGSSLWGMGNNGSGDLGIGVSADDIYLPTAILPGPAFAVPAPVLAVAGGAAHTLFTTSDGSLWAMGDDTYGELGNGQATTSGFFLPQLIVLGVPPALGITLYQKQPVVFYPTFFGGYHKLLTTTNLTSGNWSNATGGVSFSGVIITNAPGSSVYRLQ